MTPTSASIDLLAGYGEPATTLAWYYGGSDRSVHRRTVLAHPAATNTKYAEYGYRNDAAAYAEVLALHPRRVLAWTSFPADATRFVFG